MVNMKIRTRHSKGVSGCHAATTRYLTRIITYLSECVTRSNITEISKACFGSGGNLTVKDAIQWLVSNKIIIMKYGRGGFSNNHTIKYYSINPEFKKLRECKEWQ